MMVEAMIHGELQALPSASPPSCPSWETTSDCNEATATVGSLRSISEVVHHDDPAPAEVLIDQTSVRALKLRAVEGRCCFGIALGILVPFALALLIVLRSSEVRQTNHGNFDAVIHAEGMDAKKEVKQAVITSAAPILDNGNAKTVTVSDVKSSGSTRSDEKSATVTDVEHAGSAHRTTSAAPMLDNGNAKTGTVSDVKSSGSTRSDEKDATVTDVEHAGSAHRTTSAAPMSDNGNAKTGAVSDVKNSDSTWDDDEKSVIVTDVEHAGPAHHQFLPRAPPDSAVHSMQHGSRNMHLAVKSIPQVHTPWYFYLVYVFSAATGIAWIVLAVREVQTRVY